MKGRALLLTVALVLAAHVAVLSLLAFRPAKEVIPKRSLPYLPPPEPPNFASREYRYTDPETGERVTETRYVVSTKLFTGELPAPQAQPPAEMSAP